jgi:CBS domain-containing protein
MGRLVDLSVTGDTQNPQVIAAQVKTPDGIKTLAWKNFVLTKQNSSYHIACRIPEQIDITGSFLLKKNVLDKQIIDINGRKVVRVNDIRLAVLEPGTFVVAVDIGTEGLMRRLGVARVIKGIGIKIPSKLILWSDVETLVSSNDNLVLSKTYDKLNTLHPSDLADIIEDFDANTAMKIFSGLDNARSADVLEEMEEDLQIKMIEGLSKEKAADILEEMPSDEAADILDSLEESKAEELLSEMEQESQDEIRELMEYDDKVVGSIMNPEFVAFPGDTTVESVVRFLKETKPEEGLMNYIYVTSARGKLLGKISLRDLILADDKNVLKSLMHKDIVYLFDDDDIDQLTQVASKYNLLSIPIVDHDMQIVGNVVIHDILDEILDK